MIKVKNDLRLLPAKFLCVLYSTFCHITEKCLVCIVSCTL